LLNIKGERFMQRYDERAELAPRDIVAKAITDEMAATGATNVYLTLAHLNPEMIKTRFPNLVSMLAKYKLDPMKDRIPIRPACHYMMGGIRTDMQTFTDIKRLLAAGEVTSVGVHGANRLASNSLAEALVFGARAASAADGPMEDPRDAGREPLKEEPPPGAVDVAGLRQLTDRHLGVERSAGGLEDAIARIERDAGQAGDADERSRAATLVAWLALHAALRREESRGGHYRSDHPGPVDAWRVRQSIAPGDGWASVAVDYSVP
jgi:L-aspartate oxidase